jgi:hypothetical protein
VCVQDLVDGVHGCPPDTNRRFPRRSWMSVALSIPVADCNSRAAGQRGQRDED